MREITYECGTCQVDTGWVTVHDEGQTTVRPCPDCRPQASDRFDRGHLYKNCWHRAASGVVVWDCEECNRRFSGDRPAERDMTAVV